MRGDLLDDVRAVLRTTPGRWEILVRGLPADLLERLPAPGEWSALDCLVRLVDAEKVVFPVRVRCFLSGEPLPDLSPERQGFGRRGRATDLAVEFTRQRQESLVLLETLSAEDLERTAGHDRFGQVTLRQMLNEWAAHDLLRTVQAERALMQHFLPGTGPWRDAFKDHDLGAATTR
ncbi:MAG: DinB family protein [Candidatus Dormibacteraeota bacterium]|nr:DinB family protein [Candidatus Dormibacteraeota bacterium]